MTLNNFRENKKVTKDEISNIVKHSTNAMKLKGLLFTVFLFSGVYHTSTQTQNDTVPYESFEWYSEPPADCPFEQSDEYKGLLFTGRYTNYRHKSNNNNWNDNDGLSNLADTWYPSWASDGRLYSPYTDGICPRMDGGADKSISWTGEYATTGHAMIEGEDPRNLRITSLGVITESAKPYEGRYPCGSLVYNGVWYYGSYTLGPKGIIYYDGKKLNWPWLGPFVGFRISEDYGRSWEPCPLRPDSALFGEDGMWGHPVKIGAPHFVDFGKNMQHSPDGKAYMVAHGADNNDPKPRMGNTSWLAGDQIYLIRVLPSVENMNDKSKWEFFGGYNEKGNAIWTNNFDKIKPLLEWNNNMGCVTITYNPGLKKYLMCITDGDDAVSKTDNYILESESLTGEWKLLTYMKDFGEQAYFVNIPSKFLSNDGKKFWLLYSGNFSDGYNGVKLKNNPPGSHYGIHFQEVEIISVNH